MTTSISWTNETWNPVTGCSKVSPGCAHCYAESLSLRRGWSALPWTPENARDNVVLHHSRLFRPLKWREPRMVFVNSMSDLFHELVPDEFIKAVFGVMMLCRQHTFQVLTKRPERMAALLPAVDLDEARELAYKYALLHSNDYRVCDRVDNMLTYDEPGAWPAHNIWLGTSVENQHFADIRIPLLMQVPAAVRFLSCEPLLGPVNLERYLGFVHEDELGIDNPDPLASDGTFTSPWCRGPDWIIVGGESGPGHRPMDLQWARDIRDQCKAAGVAFWYKQSGGPRPEMGTLLDGREYHEFPEVAANVH